MRLSSTLLFAAAVLLQPSMSHAQAPAPAEGNRAVADGGVFVPGWSGKVDATAESSGESVKNAKLTKDGDVLQVMTGPAVTYWNPANTASGNYTVKATFTEPKYMNLNDHPHPYGIVIAGNDLGTPQQSYLYCAANGNGSFIVRGFGPEPFQLNGRRAEANASGAQGGWEGSARHSGNCSLGEGRQGRVRHQRDRRRQLRQSHSGDCRQTEVDRRRVWHPLRAQH